ncbi:aminotransferase class V-fold PLP-dependent enzyme [Luteolibacter ambystomatis]|uniref:Aminotransferase class V-fold PLP-dependent enzyme n=1 Tax=Luteolibacter ambystomatis TaxID=2824561 RepID=A0A975PGR7_9BACT|nr:aminotransferase class V-fold PLP-dependent enzyme [Luteolibacter ambystomatis]QUE53003.1 aminotransferase class V-fold PLP-dependent enzyme [Luteolibacter ambystomatis]
MKPRLPDVSPLRHHWPLTPGMVFLNHGSYGACPSPVIEKQIQLRWDLDAAPVQFLHRRHTPMLDAARNEVASFLGADPANLVFVTNTTTGVNAVMRSLEFSPGDEILITSHGYNACNNVVREVARRTGAVIVEAGIPFPIGSPELVTEAILSAVTPRTKLALIDHVTSKTGLVLPLEEILRGLEERGVETLVDGAHAPGMLPLDLESLRPSYYTANLHKWVCAPKGAAILWVRPDRQETLQPAVISHGNNTPRPGHSAFQDRFDWDGTHDTTAALCAPEVIRWLEGLAPGGWPEIRERNHRMVIEGRNLLCDRLGLIAPCPDSMIGSMSTLPMPAGLETPHEGPDRDPVYVRLFDEFGIELQVFPFEGRRWFRISSHLHNTPDEYRYLADVLERMAAGR